MIKFKRDKIFEQFIPVFANCKEIEKPKNIKFSGLCKIYKTDYNDIDVLAIANAFNFKLTGDNDNASRYHKVDGKHEIFLIFNKNDNSIMISIVRKRYD